jgi:hypothetical protein
VVLAAGERRVLWAHQDGTTACRTRAVSRQHSSPLRSRSWRVANTSGRGRARRRDSSRQKEESGGEALSRSNAAWLSRGGEWHRRGRCRVGVDEPVQTGRWAADFGYCAHGGPEFRTLMRAMIETGHVVPVLCHYDAGLAGGTHRSGQSATAPIALAKRQGFSIRHADGGGAGVEMDSSRGPVLPNRASRRDPMWWATRP